VHTFSWRKLSLIFKDLRDTGVTHLLPHIPVISMVESGVIRRLARDWLGVVGLQKDGEIIS
jgi:hypothetical protein